MLFLTACILMRSWFNSIDTHMYESMVTVVLGMLAKVEAHHKWDIITFCAEANSIVSTPLFANNGQCSHVLVIT